MANPKAAQELISLNLEKQILASLIKYPEVIFNLEHVLESSCFSNSFHACCFSLLKESAQKKEKIDAAVLSQRLINIGLSKYEELDSLSYIDSISYNSLADKDITILACQELIKLKKLRDLLDQNLKVEKFILENKDKSIDNICFGIDKLNNEIITRLDSNTDIGINVFETMEKNIEDRVINPPKDFWHGPFPTINRIFGSITIPSNITLVGARTGANKTNLALFYALDLVARHDVRIIYCDYGELNIESVQNRLFAMMCKGTIPYHMVVRGTWKKNPEFAKIGASIWKKIKNYTLIYYDVGNMSPKEIISLIRRAYYSKIGRGNTNCLLVYDYLKPFDHSPQQADWQLMSQFAKDLKTLINNEIPIPAWMSIQMNRLGITNNKKSSQVDDSENSMQVDRVLHNASLGFLLRQKTTDELLEENNEFGGIKMIPVKHREILGDDYTAAFKPVRILDGSWRKNYINLDMRSFYFSDMGDLNQMMAKLNNQVKLHDDSDTVGGI